MNKVPQRDDIWKNKEEGFLARITGIGKNNIYFYDNQDGCFSIGDMENSCSLNDFKKSFIFVGDGKPLDVLFEVQDDK